MNNTPAGGEGSAGPATSGNGKGLHKMTVYEILVTRGKRKRMMASKEDPFERIERQLRAAKRFRVEEYIRSLATDSRVDEDEQRRRYAFFFGGDRSSSSSPLGTALATPPPAGPPVAPPRTTSLTAGPSPPPLVAQAQPALTRSVGQGAAVITSTPSALFALPATHPATMHRLHHQMPASGTTGGPVGSIGLPASTSSCGYTLQRSSLYPPSRPNILATASPSLTSGSSSPEASPVALASLSSPVSSPAVHSPRGPPVVAQSSAPSASSAAARQAAGSTSSSPTACCCSPPPSARAASPSPSGGWVSPSTPTKRTTGSSGSSTTPHAVPQQPAPASGMCN